MFTDDNMFAHYLKHGHINQSWHCLESFETKDTKRYILAQFERCLEVENDENMLKAMAIGGAF